MSLLPNTNSLTWTLSIALKVRAKLRRKTETWRTNKEKSHRRDRVAEMFKCGPLAGVARLRMKELRDAEFQPYSGGLQSFC